MRNDWKRFEGQVFQDNFPLKKLLGSTSYSGVFLTQTPPPDPKTLAIKFIHSGATADFHTALLRRASKLVHPNLLRLLPGGPCRLGAMDLVFGVMEYANQDLGKLLRHRALTKKEAQEMLGPLLDALGYVHGQGFAHSHIKPSNIMARGKEFKFSNDTVLPLREPHPAYRPLDVYDAPEAGSAPVAPSHDVWSLGVTLAEALTQQAPVSPQSQGDPAVPSTIPQPFFDIVRNCLRRDPRLRWTTAQIKDSLMSLPSSLPHLPAPVPNDKDDKDHSL